MGLEKGDRSGRDPMTTVVFFIREAVKKTTVLSGLTFLLVADVLIGGWVYELAAQHQLYLSLFGFKVSLGWLLSFSYSAVQIVLAHFIIALWRGEIDLGASWREKTLAAVLLMVAAVVSISDTIGDVTIVDWIFHGRNPLEFSFDFFLHGEGVSPFYRAALVSVGIVCGLNEFLSELFLRFYVKKPEVRKKGYQAPKNTAVGDRLRKQGYRVESG